jgi:hypothetical protein
MLWLASLIAGTLIAHDAQVTLIMPKELADFPGNEGFLSRHRSQIRMYIAAAPDIRR